MGSRRHRARRVAGKRQNWPNAFSQFIGDKGVWAPSRATRWGLRVPAGAGKSVGMFRPFEFGEPTESGDVLGSDLSQRSRSPGKFSTVAQFRRCLRTDVYRRSRWHRRCPSVLIQDGVAAGYRRKPRCPREDSDYDYVEGRARSGGTPSCRVSMSRRRYLTRWFRSVSGGWRRGARKHLGPVRLEWAHDGSLALVAAIAYFEGPIQSGVFLNPGVASEWLMFDPSDGLDKLASAHTGGSASVGRQYEVSSASRG